MEHTFAGPGADLRYSLKPLYMLAKISNSGNLTQVADELCVTKSALSHQMKRLEKTVGKPLFYKDGRNIKLKPEVQKWANDLY